MRQAGIGFTASAVSDTITNSIRVVKTVRQTYESPISYVGATKVVIEKDGLLGLFGRGLQTRIIANGELFFCLEEMGFFPQDRFLSDFLHVGTQGLMFSVLWRLIDDAIAGKK